MILYGTVWYGSFVNGMHNGVTGNRNMREMRVNWLMPCCRACGCVVVVGEEVP